MRYKDVRLTFPHFGKYNKFVVEWLENMGLNVIPPLTPNKKILAKGVEYSPELICMPFKVSLGSLMDSLDRGANFILHANTHGMCRFRCYYDIQAKMLQKLGYDFNMYVISANPFSFLGFLMLLMRLNPNLSIYEIMRQTKKSISKIYGFDNNKKEESIKIGVVGELYTMIAPEASMNFEKLLDELEVQADLSLNMTHFFENLKAQVSHTKFLKNRKWKKRAKEYFGEKIGGHAFDSIYNTLKFIDKGYNGIIHVLPLSCMPEGSIEQIIQQICNEYKVSLLTLKFDESGSPTILRTQLETFCEMLRRKKQRS